MKKSVFAAMALAAAIFASCDPETSFVREFEDATMELSKSTVNVSEVGTTDVVTITTDETSIDVTVDYSCKSWLSATLSDKTVTIKAIAENPTVEERTGKVSVFAGSNGKTVQKYITVIQAGADPSKIPSLEVSSLKVTLANKAGDVKTVEITTNQSPVSVTVNESGAEWIKAEITGTTLTFTSLQDNPETVVRNSYVTVNAGSLKKIIDIAQAPGESKTCPYKVGDKYGDDGMVASIDEDAKTLLLVSLKQYAGAFSTNVTNSTGVSDASVASGAEGTSAIQKLPDYSAEVYPAVAWVVSLGNGWYMPSVVELKTLANGIKSIDADGGLTSINAKLATHGGDAFVVGMWYWSVVEASAANEQAIRITKDGDNSTTQGNYKKSGTSNRGVRAVKVVSY